MGDAQWVEPWRTDLEKLVDTAGETLAVAMRHHQSGRLQDAERLYRQILAEQPRHADALHLLGVIALQVGRHQVASELIQRAIAISPNAAPYHCNLGAAYQALRQLDDAVVCFRTAVELQPEFPQAQSNLGSVLLQLGQTTEASSALRTALELNPADVEALLNLGVACKEQGDLQEAVSCYQRVIELKPDYAEAYCNLGNAQKLSGHLAEALAAFERALQLKPDYPEAHLGRGASLHGQGRLLAAISCYQQVLGLKPDYAEAHWNLGNALREAGQLAEAVAALQRGVELQPSDSMLQLHLGMALKQSGCLAEAQGVFEGIIQREPGLAEAHGNLGVVLQEQGKFDEAIASYSRALELKADFDEALAQQVYQKFQICDWEGVDDQAARVVNAAIQPDSRISPFLVLNLSSSAAEQLAVAQQWAERIQETCRAAPFAFNPSRKSRLTIGYLSGDFRDHPVANLAVELFERHDRSRFVVNAYSFGPDDGTPIRDRLKQAFDQFVEVGSLSYQQIAEKIHTDGVDILIDMMGYTRSARSQIMALRPAPIQVNYLGYPGTMGAEFIDYVVVDDFVVPSDQQQHFAERLVHLPGTFFVNDSQRPFGEEPTRGKAGLPEDGFVFCCFNQARKIRPQVYDVWMRLLSRVSGSVLWLPKPNRFALANLVKETRSRGIDPQRVIFAEKTPTLAEHLARLRCADLFLDTWPYNAHATASDALSAGCPLVTFAGETFVSRVAGSLLRVLGLSELVAASPERYEQLAFELACDTGRRTAVREKLAAANATSRLYSGAQLARHLEAAYTRMWEIRLDGGRPQPITITTETS